ncbi:DUF2167 domain-containing protein [Labilibaculum sp.]|uniref:DUF2167 domain-containing protein n=1 Tax=Labilibaculum sp. TaxID=2060723 RepID=UPI0035661658
MKYTLLVLLIFSINFTLSAQYDSIYPNQDKYKQIIDSINNSFTYQNGSIQLVSANANILVPEGYKFLDSEQSEYVLSDLWDNPPQEVLGMLFPNKANPLDADLSFAVEITYSEEGYIEDEEAKNIDYSDLLEEMMKDTENENPSRKEAGYPAIHLIGWASSPFYDMENKKLHWAKELKFENYESNTLNYSIRILGRKGYLNLNAIGDIDILPEFQKDASKIISSVQFNPGNQYQEFNPEIDKVAAYGIGGLIAGSALPKVGFFAKILKFWKLILIGGVGFIAAFKKKLFLEQED